MQAISLLIENYVLQHLVIYVGITYLGKTLYHENKLSKYLNQQQFYTNDFFGQSSELNKIVEIQPNVFYHIFTANNIVYNGEELNVKYILMEK